LKTKTVLNDWEAKAMTLLSQEGEEMVTIRCLIKRLRLKKKTIFLIKPKMIKLPMKITVLV
jgi:hypothetical protein